MGADMDKRVFLVKPNVGGLFLLGKPCSHKCSSLRSCYAIVQPVPSKKERNRERIYRVLPLCIRSKDRPARKDPGEHPDRVYRK